MGEWRKSTFCRADEPMCVEISADGEFVVQRDAFNDKVLYTRREFSAFLQGVKAGEFDDLI